MKLNNEEWQRLENLRKNVEKRGFDFIYTNERCVKIYRPDISFTKDNMTLEEVEVFIEGFNTGYKLAGLEYVYAGSVVQKDDR